MLPKINRPQIDLFFCKNFKVNFLIPRGEKCYMDEVAERLESMVDAAKNLLQEISVIDYSRVA